MLLVTLSKHFLNTGASTTSLGSLSQCLTTLGKEMLPITRYKGEELSTFLSSGSWKEQWGHSSGSFSLNYTKPSAAPQRTFLPVPLDALDYPDTVWPGAAHSTAEWGHSNAEHSIMDNHLLWLAGYALPDAPQDAFCNLGCQGTLLAPIEPAVSWPHRILYVEQLSSQSLPMYTCTPRKMTLLISRL